MDLNISEVHIRNILPVKRPDYQRTEKILGKYLQKQLDQCFTANRSGIRKCQPVVSVSKRLKMISDAANLLREYIDAELDHFAEIGK